VLASHVIEHIANPLKALYEWKRVLKEDGAIVIIAPHFKTTFDHKRQLTSFGHMIGDYNRNTSERDLSHLPEILSKPELRLDPNVTGFEAWAERSKKNYENRELHHHVFIPSTLIKLLDYVGFKIIYVNVVLTQNIVVVAKKVPVRSHETRSDLHKANLAFLSKDAQWRSNSLFKIDKAD
jgi:ubiquinone/menaquinone biosynthesis C-methylase UbiE